MNSETPVWWPAHKIDTHEFRKKTKQLFKQVVGCQPHPLTCRRMNAATSVDSQKLAWSRYGNAVLGKELRASGWYSAKSNRLFPHHRAVTERTIHVTHCLVQSRRHIILYTETFPLYFGVENCVTNDRKSQHIPFFYSFSRNWNICVLAVMVEMESSAFPDIWLRTLWLLCRLSYDGGWLSWLCADRGMGDALSPNNSALLCMVSTAKLTGYSSLQSQTGCCWKKIFVWTLDKTTILFLVYGPLVSTCCCVSPPYHTDPLRGPDGPPAPYGSPWT